MKKSEVKNYLNKEAKRFVSKLTIIFWIFLLLTISSSTEIQDVNKKSDLFDLKVVPIANFENDVVSDSNWHQTYWELYSSHMRNSNADYNNKSDEYEGEGDILNLDSSSAVVVDNLELLKKSDSSVEQASFSVREIDPIFVEYAQYMINDSDNPGYGVTLNVGSKLVAVSEANAAIPWGFQVREKFMQSVVNTFFPQFSEEEIVDYLLNFSVLTGESVDYVLDIFSKGSWGTTLPRVNEHGNISFDTISFSGAALRDGLVSPNLIAQEFFQAHQYNKTFAQLYNSGYLADVEGVDSPEHAFFQIREGNWRAFLEIIQVQYLYENGVHGNAYTFNVNGTITNPDDSEAAEGVAATFIALNDSIEQFMGRRYTTLELLDPDTIIAINDAFRIHYKLNFDEKNIPQNQRNIWNTVGIYRQNEVNTLNIIPTIILD